MHRTISSHGERRWRGLNAWFFIGLSLILFAASVAAAARGISALFVPVVPCIVIERVFDVGLVDLNEGVDWHFKVSNAGNAEMVIHKATTSCRCIGEHRQGSSDPLVELSVASGESVVLGVKFIATGELNMPSYVGVKLFTNDPEESETSISIKYIPTAKILALPFLGVTSGKMGLDSRD